MAALELAAALARDRDGELLIVHVAPRRDAFRGASPSHDRDLLALHRLLEETRPRDPRVAFRHLMLHGEPAPTIVGAAEREGADVILVAAHGRGGLGRPLLDRLLPGSLLLGSVAEAVVRTAACPVLTLRS
jgi:nucleotide-binding universal stress UspA family protein